MSRVLLNIGHQSILLPDDKGLASVITTLARGLSVWDHTYKDEVEIEDGALKISMKRLPAKTRFVTKEERELTPEEQGYVRIKPKRLNGQATLFLEGGAR